MPKRRILSIGDKIEMIREMEIGTKHSVICSRYGLSHSTVSTFWKNRTAIRAAYNNNETKKKKMRNCKKVEVDRALLKWFRTEKDIGRPIARSTLKSMAECFAKQFGYTDFVCSSGWLDRFKRRHNLSYNTMDSNATIPKLPLEEYSEDDIYSANEIGLFYDIRPRDAAGLTAEKCEDGALEDQRLTIFLCTNRSGTEKCRLLVISHAQIEHDTAVDVVTNRKAWMTREIYASYLYEWDYRLQNRKILLIVEDHPTTHPRLDNLKNIVVMFMPTNGTPIDFGISTAFKTQYRQSLIELDEMKISLNDTLQLLDDAWNRVAQSTISNAFTRAFNESDDLPLEVSFSNWLKGKFITRYDALSNIDDYPTFDDHLTTSGIPSFEDIVDEVRTTSANNDPKPFARKAIVETVDYPKTFIKPEFKMVQPLKNSDELAEWADQLENYVIANGDEEEAEVLEAIQTIRRYLRGNIKKKLP